MAAERAVVSEFNDDAQWSALVMLATLANLWQRRIPRPPLQPLFVHREEVAQRFLSGSGLEIGGLNAPLPVPRRVRVTYVDRMTVPDLLRHYPELSATPLVAVDVIDDGERLGTIADESQQFVIANHFIEHCQDPIGTLKAHLRVLRPGGVLFWGVPLRHMTFDRDRPGTPWEHIRRDHLEGPAWSYRMHYEEWVDLVDRTPADQRENRLQNLISKDYSIHFHTWNEPEFLDFLERAIAEFQLPAEIAYARSEQIELVTVIRKCKA